jgi:hypothetical protein
MRVRGQEDRNWRGKAAYEGQTTKRQENWGVEAEYDVRGQEDRNKGRVAVAY